MDTITNNAQIKYQYNTSGKTVNSSTNTNYVTTNISKTNISLLKTSNVDYFAPGEKINYNIFIANSSNLPIFNVSIVDNIPNCLIFLENSATITNKKGEISQLTAKDIKISNEQTLNLTNNKAIEFFLGNFANNETSMLSYTVQMPLLKENLPKSIDTYATLFYSNKSEETTTRNSINSNINSISKAFALLVAEKIVDKTTAFCGDKLIYTISIKNKGNIDATNVRITDILPNNFKLEDINFVISDLPYKASYNIDDNNTLNIPATSDEVGLCIPANTSDNSIIIKGYIKENS